MKKILLLLSVLCIFHTIIQAQNWDEIIKLQTSDRAAGDYFGNSVAISGDYAILGAPEEDEDADGNNTLYYAGSAYIFKNNAGTWEQVQKIGATDRTADDYFGYSVAISDNYAIVGVPGDDEDASGGNIMEAAGSVYIFKNNSGSWVQVQKIVASDRNTYDNFGSLVAIDGDYIVVATEYEDEDASGNNTLSHAGSAYIFKNNAGTWEQVQKIVASDRSKEDAFGHSVAISGDYCILGSLYDSEDASGGSPLYCAGSAYIFKNNAGTWVQVQKIVASDRAAEDAFGSAVAISGDYAIVGALVKNMQPDNRPTIFYAGSAYIFKNNAGTWEQIQKIVASDCAENDRFGASVAIDGDYAIVGAIYEDEDANGGVSLYDAGSAYIYKNSNAKWTQVQKIVASDRADADYFGSSVAISGDYAMIGAPYEDAVGNETILDAGSVYVFKNFPEINIKQNSINIANGGSFYMGNVNFGNNSDPFVFTIENTGYGGLRLSEDPKIEISGVNSSDFTIDQASTSSPVPASGSTTFSITFTPSALGVRTAEINIVNDDADENPYHFIISGAGLDNTGIESLQKNGILIYPNPTHGILTCEFTKNKIRYLKIADIDGKTIIQKNNLQQKEIFDLSGLKSGIYIINIQTDKEAFTAKILKH